MNRDHSDMRAETERIMALIALIQTRLGNTNNDFSQDEIAEINDLLTKARQLLENDDARGLGILTGQLHPRSGWSERFSVANGLSAPMDEVWRLASAIERWLARQPNPAGPTPDG